MSRELLLKLGIVVVEMACRLLRDGFSLIGDLAVLV